MRTTHLCNRVLLRAQRQFWQQGRMLAFGLRTIGARRPADPYTPFAQQQSAMPLTPRNIGLGPLQSTEQAQPGASAPEAEPRLPAGTYDETPEQATRYHVGCNEITHGDHTARAPGITSHSATRHQVDERDLEVFAQNQFLDHPPHHHYTIGARKQQNRMSMTAEHREPFTPQHHSMTNNDHTRQERPKHKRTQHPTSNHTKPHQGTQARYNMAMPMQIQTNITKRAEQSETRTQQQIPTSRHC